MHLSRQLLLDFSTWMTSFAHGPFSYNLFYNPERKSYLHLHGGEARATREKLNRKINLEKQRLISRISSQIVTPLKKKAPVSLKKSFLKFSF